MTCVSCGHEPQEAAVFYFGRNGPVCGPCYVVLLSGAQGGEPEPRPLDRLWSTVPHLWRR